MYVAVYILGVISGAALLCVAIGAGFNTGSKEDKHNDYMD